MILGRFGNTTGRPYIEARIAFPRLKVVGNISFLADTGADSTAIMPLDGARLGVDYSALLNPNVAIGAGGASKHFREPALVAFLESGVRICAYLRTVLILEAKPEIMSLPSLLGRDVMSQWVLTYDKPHDKLSADVVAVDHEYPLPPTTISLPSDPAVAPPPVLP